MNILQNLTTSDTYCVTLNSNHSINKEKVIKEIQYEHPLFTSSAIISQKRKNEISGINNTYYFQNYNIWNISK